MEQKIASDFIKARSDERKEGLLDVEELEAMQTFIKETSKFQSEKTSAFILTQVDPEVLTVLNVYARHIEMLVKINLRILEHLLQQAKNRKLN